MTEEGVGQAVLHDGVEDGVVGGGDDDELHRQQAVGAGTGDEQRVLGLGSREGAVVPHQRQLALADGVGHRVGYVVVDVEAEEHRAVAAGDVGQRDGVHRVGVVYAVVPGVGQQVLDGGLVVGVLAVVVDRHEALQRIAAAVAVHDEAAVEGRRVGHEGDAGVGAAGAPEALHRLVDRQRSGVAHTEVLEAVDAVVRRRES